jgi:hypothetical protein
MAAKGVDRAGALPNQMMAHAMQRHCCLLLDGLHGNESHARPLHGFATGFGVGSVVFVGFDVGADKLRRH